MAEEGQDDTWNVKFREDEEMEFFTELALHETERWIQAVTRKKFAHPDDPRKSLEDGILLCELLNCLRPTSVKRINKQATPIAGLDNLNVFLNSLKSHFGLQDTHLFDAADLEDLSQRAIAESDQLKQEVDRRLRNVAITVYWLGKAVSHSFQGPQLDFSAFTPLVHHHSKDIISNEHIRRDSSCSWESYEYSSAYGSHEGNSLGNIPENNSRHQRESLYESYASYEKVSEDSLDEQVFDNMPVRYGSQSALNKSGDGLYPDERQSGMYRSSPDLSQGTYHCRSSSNDSLDGSYHGSHSRQSSGGSESYPTRAQRRTSSSTADPLQFVKFHRQTELAKQAEEQMKLAATQKEQKEGIVGEKEKEKVKEEDDWQSNLSSWKSRRKSQSQQAYQLKEELEAQEKGEEEVKTTQQTKTFSQMQQERERRKSASTRNFYPLEENEDENDVITPSRADVQESSSSKSTLSSTYKTSPVADWAQDSDSDGEKEDDNNNSLSVDKENGMTEDPFDEPEKSPRNKPSPAKRRFGNAESDNWKQSSAESWDVHDRVSKQNSRNSLDSAYKINKISGIRNRFEQTEEQPKSSRSTTVDTKVDLKSRKKSFEKFGKDNFVEPSSRIPDSGASERNYSKRSATDSSEESHFGRNNVSESVTMETRYSRSIDSDRGAYKDSHTRNPTWIYDQISATTRNVYSSLRTSGRRQPILKSMPLAKTGSPQHGMIIHSTVTKNSKKHSTSDLLQDYTEKNIKISQKPNSEKGFGFTISGGADTTEPITVLKVKLGSAADVCEVMAKDEILSVNKSDISRKTNQEVGQLIEDAVKSGQLELRVKRFLGGNDEDEDDFLSSDEEVESLERSWNNKQRTEETARGDNNTSYDSRDSRTSQEDFRAAVNNNPVASALDEERQWLDQTDYGDSAQQNPQNEETSNRHTHQDSPPSRAPRPEPELEPERIPAAYVSPTVETEVETRRSITVRRERSEVTMRGEMEDDTNPVATFDSKYEVEMRGPHRKTVENDGSSGDDFGPPAILRKWQRQRPQSEYTFAREKSPDKRLSSTLPWMENKLSTDENSTKDDFVLERATRDFTSSQPEPPVPSPRRWFDDQKKQEEWNERQEEIRQQPVHNENDSQLSQEKFSQNQSELQHDYEDDIRRAQEMARQREEQERQMLEPELERMRLTEERRQERRMRQQQLQQSTADPNQDKVQSYQSHEQPPQQTVSNAWSEPEENSRSSMSFQIHGQDDSQGPPGVLVIDPRNRGDDDPGYSFHVNINQPDSRPVHQIAYQPDSRPVHQIAYQPAAIDIETIREEERRKIMEEERRKREEEEERRFREKEAQLRQQEEQLREKEERLRQEQERFHREQEELQRLRDSAEQKTDVMRFEAPVTRVREASPSYQSTVIKKRPEVLRTNTAPQYSTTVVVEPKGHYTVKAVSPSAEAIRSSTDPSGRSRWSRDDMKAMNRKATPLQSRPDVTPPTSPTSSGPIKRSSLSREQVHSLNAVPKPKFRSSQDWIGGDQSMQHNPRSGTSRHSDIMKKQYTTPQEHWLFEEAERRRRMASQDPKPHSRQSSHSQFSGPIKPSADNRWREEPAMDRQNAASLNTSFERPHAEGNMPAAIRQTLLQKTAGARGSTGSNYSQDLGVSYNQYPNPGPSLTQTLPASYSYHSQSYQVQEEPLPPSTRAPPPPDHKANASMSLSGRQLCSHCSQELGYGAAMIIESLGLSYHVQCFKCCVCHTPLGNGQEGADVRVRVNKLHCPNCYSNDEAGLKFSKV